MRASPVIGLRGLVAAAVGVVALAAAAPAFAGGSPGAVYVQTNTAPTNYVQVFTRGSDGALATAGRFATGGAGNPAANPPLVIPFLDSAGSVELSDNGRLLFVVNAGSDSVSSFRVTSGGLELADTEPTFGSRPISATSFNSKLLYVLNSNTGTASISGYRVTQDGSLTPIAGSVQATADTGGLPAQIKFSAHGDLLAVTQRFEGATGAIDTFLVGGDGVAQAAVSHPATDETPFGLDFTRRNQMIVSNEHFSNPGASTMASYDVGSSGSVTPVDVQPTNAGAACWTVITNDNRFVYATAPFTLSIVGFRISPAGGLAPITPTSHVAEAGGLTLDEDVSHDSRFLYVLSSAFFAGDTVLSYRIENDGTLTAIGETAPFEGSAAGLAAW
jgi:6-phosphogluconolactonase